VRDLKEARADDEHATPEMAKMAQVGTAPSRGGVSARSELGERLGHGAFQLAADAVYDVHGLLSARRGRPCRCAS